MEKDRPQPVVGVILVALAALLAVGLLAFARPCAVHADGSVGSCVWAHRALFGADAVLGIIALVRVFELDEGERRGLSFSAALVGALIAATPGFLIGLCAYPTMPCHGGLLFLARSVGGAVALVGATDLTRRLLTLRKR